MRIYINTCVLPRCELEAGKIYREEFADIGFELLPMFDLAEFEANLEANVDFFREVPVSFHEPVFCVEHSAPKGTPKYACTMHHMTLTKKYADILHPSYMVYHLNNCAVTPATKAEILNTSLANLKEIREMFAGVDILVENTGTDINGDKLLDQQEFTDLCLRKDFDVLIDIGHAHANSWDIKRLIHDLRTQIRGFHLHNNDGLHDQHNRLLDGSMNFPEVMSWIRTEVPDADLVIEYTRPEYHGAPLLEDIKTLCRML